MDSDCIKFQRRKSHMKKSTSYPIARYTRMTVQLGAGSSRAIHTYQGPLLSAIEEDISINVTQWFWLTSKESGGGVVIHIFQVKSPVRTLGCVGGQAPLQERNTSLMFSECIIKWMVRGLYMKGVARRAVNQTQNSIISRLLTSQGERILDAYVWGYSV